MLQTDFLINWKKKHSFDRYVISNRNIEPWTKGQHVIAHFPIDMFINYIKINSIIID